MLCSIKLGPAVGSQSPSCSTTLPMGSRQTLMAPESPFLLHPSHLGRNSPPSSLFLLRVWGMYLSPLLLGHCQCSRGSPYGLNSGKKVEIWVTFNTSSHCQRDEEGQREKKHSKRPPAPNLAPGVRVPACLTLTWVMQEPGLGCSQSQRDRVNFKVTRELQAQVV